MKAIDDDTVLRIVARTLRSTATSLTPHTDLYADLHLDSLGALEILIELEDAYEVDIGTEDAKRLRTIRDIVELLHRLKPEGSPA